MNFSKSFRRNLYTAEFAWMVMGDVKPNGKENIKNLKRVRPIRTGLEKILEYIYPGFPNLKLDDWQYKNYKQTQSMIKKLCDDWFSSTEPNLDLINAVLYLIEQRVADSKLSNNNQLPGLWCDVLNKFFLFYNDIDDEILTDEYKIIKFGHLLGMKIEKIISR